MLRLLIIFFIPLLIHRKSLSSQMIISYRMKFAIMFLIVVLQTVTISLISRLKKALSQLDWFVTLLIRFISAFWKCQTSFSEGQGYWIFKSDFIYTFGWWQFTRNDGCAPGLITKFGWNVSVKSTKEEELSNKLMGLLIIWLKSIEQLNYQF